MRLTIELDDGGKVLLDQPLNPLDEAHVRRSLGKRVTVTRTMLDACGEARTVSDQSLSGSASQLGVSR